MGNIRRRFLQTAFGTSLLTGKGRHTTAADKPHSRVSMSELERIAAMPVLQVKELTAPVMLTEMELLRNGREFLVRVRSKDGAEGLAVPNSMHMVHTYPIFLNRVAPFFRGKDARELEPLLWELYRHDDNYKYQGLALWVCVAAAEFAILDLLGKLTGKSVGNLLGGVKRTEIAVYRASGNRGNTPEAEVEYLQQIVAESGAKALKFRVGGRMSKNADSLPGRTERLIPLVRETFGPGMTIYADSNSSYDVPEAIRVGRIMEKYDYGFFEEPCRFDQFEEMQGGRRCAADSGGGRRAGVQRVRLPLGDRPPWGRHRSARPALPWRLHSLAAGGANGPCGGDALHAAHVGLGAGLPRRGPFCLLHRQSRSVHRVQGQRRHPGQQSHLVLKCEQGTVRVPSGPGFGVTVDPDFVKRSSKMTTF